MSTRAGERAFRPARVPGLGGACFEVLEPLITAGRWSNPTAWRAQGASRPHRSSLPPLRVPAGSTRATRLGVPGTFPPEPENGLSLSGIGTAAATGTDPNSASDPELYPRIAERLRNLGAPE